MKKILMIATGAAFLGGTALAPTPASAMFPFLPIVLLAKQNEAPKAKPAAKAKKTMAKAKKSKKKM